MNHISIIKSVLVGIGVWVLASCQPSEQEQAAQVYEKIDSLYEAGDTAGASRWIDTLASRYPKQVAVRKKAKVVDLKMKIAKQKALKASAEGVIDSLREAFNDATSQFVFEKDEKFETEGKYVVKGQQALQIMGRTVLKPIVTEQGNLQLNAIIAGAKKVECVELWSGDEKMKGDTAVLGSPYNYEWSDGARAYRTVILRDNQRNLDLAEFVVLHKKDKISTSYGATLTPQEKDAIGKAADLARKMQQLRGAEHVITVANKKLAVYEASLQDLEKELSEQKQEEK